MSQLSFSLFDSMLVVRDAQGRYLPASMDQILSVARQAIDQKYQRGALFTFTALIQRVFQSGVASFAAIKADDKKSDSHSQTKELVHANPTTAGDGVLAG